MFLVCFGKGVFTGGGAGGCSAAPRRKTPSVFVLCGLQVNAVHVPNFRFAW